MFFFLSKTLYYLAMPYSIVFVLLVLALALRNTRWKKRCLWSAVIMMYFFSNDFIVNEIMKAWEVETRAFSELPEYKMAVVLTGATVPYREPSDRIYFARGVDRVTHTVQMYKLGKVERILISGGIGTVIPSESEIPEANKFRDAMVMMGVPDSVITLENKTRNTAESAIEVARLLSTEGISPDDCVLVTSAFHMRRSLACYRKAGAEMDTFSTDFYGMETRIAIDTLFLPQVDAISKWHKLFKEWIGMAAYKIAGYI